MTMGSKTNTKARVGRTPRTGGGRGGFPMCVQCGTRANPCRCKVVGPTLGFVAFLVAAVVEWPVGALVWCFRHSKGRRIMGHPVTRVYPRVANAIPF